MIDLICICCRNINCEGYTHYKGNLICEYCLDDWLKDTSLEYDINFDNWCVQHKIELEEELKQKVGK